VTVILCRMPFEGSYVEDERERCQKPAVVFYKVSAPFTGRTRYFARCKEHGWTTVHVDTITRNEYLVSQIMES
jgi:hypothetical protein